MKCQRTIRNTIHCQGIGLHSGKPATLTLKPAAADTGIVFVRTDRGGQRVAAVAANTGNTSYATTICENGVCVRTIEHLLSALAGLSIDNVVAEIDAEEVPIMDGSARPFIRFIAESGIRIQETNRPMIKVLKPMFVRDGSKQIAVWPAEAPSISYFIDFSHPMLKEQSLQYFPSEDSYLREVADARTFGFIRDVRTLQSKGLALGASLENAVALTEDSVLNREGLRYKDEFVRHKILDLIGDLALAGMPIIGHVVAHKSGHALNARMVGKILSSPQNWLLIGADDKKVRQPVMQRQPALV